MSSPAPVLFLPGASGDTRFWRPVSERLAYAGARTFAAYPGFGGAPPDPALGSLDDLFDRVLAGLREPTHVIAQSMGGVLALRAALARPALVRSLVLTATSGGLDVRALGAADWRASFAQTFPSVPDWFARDRSDLTAQLGAVKQPVLLIWGDSDPISPVAVGEALCARLPHAELVVLAGGDHDLARDRADEVARHVERHLTRA